MHTYDEVIVLAHWEISMSGTVNGYPVQSHYPDTEVTGSCLIPVVLGARLRIDKYQFDKLLA